jgi:hypothetical protein
MIKHIVVFKLKESAEGASKAENVQRLKSKLEALDEIIDEIKFFEVGINFANSNSTCDLVLCSEFETLEDLYSYQKHPEHLKVVDFVGKACENRIVVDYNV